MDLKGKCEEMAGMPPEGSQFDARRYDAKMNDSITSDGQDFFTSYDEVYNSFDSMELQENLSRGIYAYGYEKPSAIQQREFFPFCNPTGAIWYLKKTLTRCKKHKVSRRLGFEGHIVDPDLGGTSLSSMPPICKFYSAGILFFQCPQWSSGPENIVKWDSKG